MAGQHKKQDNSEASGSAEETTKRNRHIPAISDESWNAFNEIRKEYEETWSDTFERFHNYQDWVDHLFRLPREVNDVAKINVSTATKLIPLWLENLRLNYVKDIEIPDIRKIKDSVNQGMTGLVIGAGPSLLANDHLNMLHDSVFYKEHKGVIITTAHGLKDCLEADVVPDYMTLVDSDQKLLKFIDHDIVDEHSENITGIFSAMVHPDVINRWKGDKLFFLPIIPEETIPNVQATIAGIFPNITEMDGMANCGSFSWNVMRYIGCNPIALIGMDLAFKPDFPVKDTIYYKKLRAMCSSDDEMLMEWYRFHTHSFFGTNCYTDFVYDSFCKGSVGVFKACKQQWGLITQNCTEGGVIDDPDVENMWFKDWLAKWE